MHLLSQLRSRDERRVPELRRRASGAAETYVVGPTLTLPAIRGGKRQAYGIVGTIKPNVLAGRVSFAT